MYKSTKTIQLKIQKANRRGATENRWKIVVDAQAKTPIDTGDLRKSAQVDKTNIGSYRVSYNESYAAIQHENLSFNHPGGGEAKYLDKATKENTNEMKAIVASRVKLVLWIGYN